MILKSDLVSSRQNEAVKRLLSLDDKKGRDTESVFVLDGIKLFEEAVKSGAEIDTVYISSEKEEQYLPFIPSALQGELYATTRVIRLETSLFERISREKSPQGVITLVKYLDKIQNIIKINKVTTFLNDGVSAQGILLLNGIQDPGNLGAVIRSAVAFGKNKIILDTDCVDIYHPRVLRATMGGIFRLRENRPARKTRGAAGKTRGRRGMVPLCARNAFSLLSRGTLSSCCEKRFFPPWETVPSCQAGGIVLK